LEERELDRLAFEAGRSYDFRLAALVRDLRGHRSMLRRYVTAHLNATQARTDQLPAATHALREAYNDAWELLGNLIAPRPFETLVPRGADRRVGERRSTIERGAAVRGAVQSVRRSAGASFSPPTGAWPNAGWASPAHSSWPNRSAARVSSPPPASALSAALARARCRGAKPNPNTHDRL
jgi:hypothetical protein